MAKRLTSLFRASLVASALIALAPTANANLITNGSFENGLAPSGAFETVPNGDSTKITDWTVAGSVDWIHSYWPAADGANSVDLSGNSQGSISQEIDNLINNTWYNLTFYLATNKDRPAPQSMAWSLGTTQSGVADALTDPNVSWVKYVFPFLWNEGSVATLVFATTTIFPGDPQCEDCFGPAIDAASLEAVPLPAALPLLLVGLGAVGFLGRSRKRKTALTA